MLLVSSYYIYSVSDVGRRYGLYRSLFLFGFVYGVGSKRARLVGACWGGSGIRGGDGRGGSEVGGGDGRGGSGVGERGWCGGGGEQRGRRSEGLELGSGGGGGGVGSLAWVLSSCVP